MKSAKIIVGLLLGTAVPVRGEPATQPTVDSVLSQMDAAYSQLGSAEFDGRISGHFDVQGQQKNEEVEFSSWFEAPNKFRHQSHDDVSMGSTGNAVYTYLTARNKYQTADAPKERGGDWPAGVARILQQQNPSLMLALAESAADDLNGMTRKIVLQAPTEIDGATYDTLFMELPADRQSLTLLVDRGTHLLHEAKYDLQKTVEKAGATDVKKAEVIVDYTKVLTDAPVAESLFAWTPPSGAVLISDAPGEAGTEDRLSATQKALIGKDAPDFSLKDLQDKEVKLSDLKGSVVIVDFWATWCAPCVAALPGLDKLYKEQSANGLKVLAVNEQDEKPKVQSFATKKGLSLPMLLDPDAVAGGLLRAESLPETVLIGKDGKIKQIFVGIGNEQAIADLVAKELK